jgi:hypothetical protein
MIRSSSKVSVEERDLVQVPIKELHLFRQNLEDALKWVNKYISQHSAETIHRQQPVEEEKTLDLFPTTRTKTRDENKRVSLGLCMFVQKKNLVGVNSREELEACKDRCRKKAYDLKGDVILCSRHKDSDIKRIEEILNGVVENVSDEPGRGPSPRDPLPEGDYKKPKRNAGPAEDIEDVLNEMSRLEKLFEENKFIPCRIKFRECALICFHGETFVVEPSGVCIGKITDKDALKSFETKAKMKEYFDVDGHVEHLTHSDLPFVEHFELYYNPQL